MTALYLPPPIQMRTLSQTLAQTLPYLAEQAFRAVGTLIGAASIVLTMIAFFGAAS
ncbi:hypothetical protein [uncultured Cohaesibacter sp.]|uniref:hypothetical protein n=1 Tax=uncultured Cohaesibacter sp. TaxID=1002546 RepID=UPI002AAA7A82|nr:hypothetical protein [uncultured Cohaesibacter sp.]